MTAGLFNQDEAYAPPARRREEALPANVWLVQQERSREQREGRYVDAVYHTQKNPPELARRMIAHHRAPPGSVVGDPFAGTGTMVCEALEMGYQVKAIDIEGEQVRGNLMPNIVRAADRIRAAGSVVPGYDVDVGDARALGWPDCSVDLIATSPPYGTSDPSRDSSGRSLSDRYHRWAVRLHKTGSHAGQAPMSEGAMGDLTWRGFTLAMRQCLREMRRVLKPGCHASIAVKEFWNKGLVDLPGLIIKEGRRAGLRPTDRIYAIEAAMNEFGILTSRASAHRHLLAVNQHADGRACPRGVPVVTQVIILQRPKEGADGAASEREGFREDDGPEGPAQVQREEDRV